MDAPPIQYARTDDGVNIAYWTLGEGRPFISTPAIPGTHLREEWNVAHLRAWYESISRDRQVVRYDPRGFGLSDRDVAEVSLDADTQDDAESQVDAMCDKLLANMVIEDYRFDCRRL